MKKILVLSTLLALAAALTAQAGGNSFSLGFEARGWKADQLEKLTDRDNVIGGAMRMQFGLADYLALDLAGGCMGAWDEVTVVDGPNRWKYDTNVFVIPVQAGLIARIPLLSSVDLVAGGGAGYYWVRCEIEDHYDRHRHHRHYEDFDLGDDWGYYALAGIDWSPAPGVSLYGEVRYDWLTFDLKDEAKEYAEETGMDKEISFDGLGAAVGLRFHF